MAREKPQNFKDHHQSNVRNFKTAQHIDKQITDVSSMINALKDITKLGASPHGVLMHPRERTGRTLCENVNKSMGGHDTLSVSK